MPSLGEFTPVFASLEGLPLIMKDLRNLLLTNPGDRPFRNTLGIGARKILFDPADQVTLALIKNRLESQIKQVDPRINLLAVNITYDLDTDIPAMNVEVRFALVSDPTLDQEENVLLTMPITV